MSSNGSAAPDVDLRKQGFSPVSVLAALSVVGFAFYYARTVTPESTDDIDNANLAAQESTWLSVGLWILKRGLQLILGCGLMLLGMLVVKQRSILYVPVPPGTQRSTRDNPRGYRSPREAPWNLPYEDVMICTEDGVRINAWLVYQPGLRNCSADEVPYTFVYFHGNAGNIGHRLENIRDMYNRLRINILIVDYRGYGDSEDGDGPHEKGFFKDALASYRWIVEAKPEEARIRPDRICIFGRSIGGAVGIKLFAHLLKLQLSGNAALPLPAGIVLENTFTSLKDMALTVFPFLGFFSLLLRPPLIFDEWASVAAIEFLARHHEHWCCCLLSGQQDQIVPPVQMRKLHNILKVNRPKVLKYFIFPTGGHNDTPTRGGPEYWVSFQKYMDLVRSSEPERLVANADIATVK